MELKFKESVEKDFRKIPAKEKEKIFKKLTTELIKNPGIDKQLSGNFKELYSYRVGNYRVFYTKIKETIFVLRVSQRKDVHKDL